MLKIVKLNFVGLGTYFVNFRNPEFKEYFNKDFSFKSYKIKVNE